MSIYKKTLFLGISASILMTATAPLYGQSFSDLLNEFADEKVPDNNDTLVQEVLPSNEEALKSSELQDVITPEAPLTPEEPDEFSTAERIKTNGVTLQGLDTETGRVYIIDAPIGQVVEFGTLRLKVTQCYKNAPGEGAESVAFITIHEKPKDETSARGTRPLFSGWMFSTSPSLSALDHPVYDVWVKECTELP